MSAVLLLWLALGQADDSKVDLEKSRLFLYDQTRGLTFKIQKDGSVNLELANREKPPGKTPPRSYAAPTAEDFARLYPELVTRYHLEGYLGLPSQPTPEDQFDRFWKELKRGGRNLPPFPDFHTPFDEDWEKWLEKQQGQMEELRKLFRAPPGTDPGPAPPRAPLPAPSSKELGIKVESVDETMRDQLSLKEDEGLMVGEVRPGSLADRAGLKTHDILLKLDGKPITDKWQFRKDTQEALGRPEFSLEILRAGKKETLKVKSAPKKDE
jgi:hypothetical protein